MLSLEKKLKQNLIKTYWPAILVEWFLKFFNRA